VAGQPHLKVYLLLQMTTFRLDARNPDPVLDKDRIDTVHQASYLGKNVPYSVLFIAQ